MVWIITYRKLNTSPRSERLWQASRVAFKVTINGHVCSAKSAARRAHDWVSLQISNLFLTYQLARKDVNDASFGAVRSNDARLLPQSRDHAKVASCVQPVLKRCIYHSASPAEASRQSLAPSRDLGLPILNDVIVAYGHVIVNTIPKRMLLGAAYRASQSLDTLCRHQYNAH